MKMLKAFLFAAVVVVAAFVQAATEIVGGIEWTYTVSSGKASIGGGSSSSTAVPKTTSGIITIPSTLGGYPVTGIKDYAFYYCSSLTSITIPDSVTSIGSSAFNSCSSLRSVTIPDSVTSIGDDAFYDCWLLIEVHISDLVKWCNIEFGSSSANPLSSSAYNHNLYLNGNKVTQLVIPDSVTSIGDYAFRGCDSLTSVTIPDSVTSIGNYAFSGCSSLTSVTLPNSVTNIGYYAFYYCSSLTSITIPDSVTSIGFCSFSGCKSLTSVTIPDSVTSIGGSAFKGCSSLTSVTIPNSVTSIGDYAFYGCSGLGAVGITGISAWCNIKFANKYSNPLLYAHNLYLNDEKIVEITIPNSITNIMPYAFNGCSSLTSVTIPGSVTSIGSSAFNGCSSLTSVTIPDNVTSIGDNAFNGCRSLKEVQISDLAKWCNIEFGNSYANPLSCAHNLYLNGTEVTQLVIPNSVTSIGSYAFYYCSKLTSVTIPNSVTSIGDNAFNGCRSLKEVHISDLAKWCNIEFGNSYANPLSCAHNLYLNGTEVTQLVIPNSVTSIGSYAFYYCSSLTSVTIPDSVTSIGNSAFYDCEWLTSVTIPDSVTSVGGYAFYGCSSLTSVTIPNSVTNIGGYAFYGCSSLTSVMIPNSVTSIGDYAFSSCYSLRSVSIPQYVCNSTFKDTFYYYSITNIVIQNGVTNIGSRAFYDCDSLTSVTIPDSVTSIGNYAFSGCDSLTSVTIPNSVTSIGNCAFLNCSKLRYLIVPESVTSIGKKAFSRCSSLCAVYFLGGPPSTGDDIYKGVSTNLTTYVPDGSRGWLFPNSSTLPEKWPIGDDDNWRNIENGSPVFVTIGFDPNGGTLRNGDLSVSRLLGFWIGAFPEVEREGYTFDGWFTASIDGDKVTENTIVVAATTYYAHWTKIVSEPEPMPTPTPTPTPSEPELGNGNYDVIGDELVGTVPENAASVYDGYLYHDNVVMGTIQAKVSKPKLNKKLGVTTAKTSVAIQITGEKKLTLKGELDLNIGEFTATDKKSDRTLILKLGIDGITGTFGTYDIDGARNFFDSKDKSEKSAAEEILKPYLGAYSMICDGGILSVNIAKKGNVTVKGTIDGNKVSAKAQVLIGEDVLCIPVIYSKKSVNLAFTIWLPIDGSNAEVIGLGDNAIIGKAGTLKNGAQFIIDGDIGASIETEDERTLELLPNGEIVTVSGSKWLVADGIKPAKVAYKKGEFTITEGRKGAGIANPSGLKLTYKSKDGSFKGSFTAYGIVKGKLKKHKASVEGVLVNGVGYGTITIKSIGTWAVTIK